MDGQPHNPELHVQSGLPLHAFTFMNGPERLDFAVPARTPEEAADKLEHMLHALIIQIRIQYPKVLPAQTQPPSTLL